MILAISTRRDLDEKKRKSKKTVTGHMQSSVTDYLLLPGGSLLLPILIKFIQNYYRQLLMKI
jgi:hypothetical protein